MPVAYPTIRLGDDAPLPVPTNSVAIKWKSEDSPNVEGQANVMGYLEGDGNTGHFLRGDGTFASPSGGGSGFPAGANIANFIPQLTVDEGTGWGGYSIMMKIPASMIAAFTSAFTVTFEVGSGGSVVVNKAVLRRTLRNSSSFTDTTTITWGSSSTPTFSASSANKSDVIGLAMDSDHDLYIIVYLDSSTAGAAHLPGWTDNVTPYSNLAGYALGDKTATSDTTGLTLTTGQWVSIAQIQTA